MPPDTAATARGNPLDEISPARALLVAETFRIAPLTLDPSPTLRGERDAPSRSGGGSKLGLNVTISLEVDD